MTSTIASILDQLEQFERTEASASLELRISLTRLVLKHLRRKRWTQSQLAEAAGMKEPFVSRVLHSDTNCTLDTIARLLFALGVRGEIREAEPISDAASEILSIRKQGKTDGQTLQTSAAAADASYGITCTAEVEGANRDRSEQAADQF